MTFLRFIHLLTFTFWFGTLLYFTLVQAPILFKALPREMFGLVQSNLFPAYYWIGYISGTVLVVTYNVLHPWKGWTNADCVKITALCLMLVLALAQGLWIGPKVGQLRVERQAAEKTQDTVRIASVAKEFGKAHGISSLLNLLLLLAGFVYLAYLSRAPQKAGSFLQGIF